MTEAACLAWPAVLAELVGMRRQGTCLASGPGGAIEPDGASEPNGTTGPFRCSRLGSSI